MAEISSDRKAERLINLTMALLAAPRYMTKSEIFANVAGYEGDEEAKSRKFERDKDDLRALGITIEVGSNDPYFDDEQGYKISRDSYMLAMHNISKEDYSLISIAVSMWRNEFFSHNGQSAIRKIQALDFEVGEPLLPKNLFADEVPHHFFDEIWHAISERKIVTFTYHSTATKKRRVAPYALTLWHGFWYLTGMDLNANEIRTFKLLRMLEGVALSRTENEFEVPVDFDAKKYLHFQERSEPLAANFAIRKDRALSLRLTSQVQEMSSGEWDKASKMYSDIDSAIADLIFYGVDIKIEGPNELKDKFLERLRRPYSEMSA